MSVKAKHSIRGKLTRMMMVTSTAAVLLACLGFELDDLRDERIRTTEDLSMLARVIGSSSEAPLTFGDRKAAEEVLHSLRAHPAIIAVGIYTAQGKLFARYTPDGATALPATLYPDGFHEARDRLELFHPIVVDHERIGTLYMASDRRDHIARVQEFLFIATAIVLVSLCIAFILSSWLQAGISEPIVELSRVASRITEHKNFSVRVSHAGLEHDDEIGMLMTGFNSMLAEIEQRDLKLQLHQTHLEDTVALRTAELMKANTASQVARNIAEETAEVNARLAAESALILNSATDGIIGLGIDSQPSFMNPAAMRMLGRSLKDLERTTVHELIHHSYPDGTPFPASECTLAATLRTGQAVPAMDGTFWRADGTSFPVEYSATPMIDPDGNPRGAVFMFRDVTERRAVERLKSEFVSTVSHELRTPLTSIRGALGLLSSGLLGPMQPKGQRMLDIAVSNTDRLVRLINDILDLERIESGRVELVRAAVDADSVMTQAVEGLQSIADQAGVRLVGIPSAGTLWADSDRLIQTLTNLIGNAIKFSPPDTTVTLSGAAAGSEFTFCIADEGRGVPEEKRESIFARFSQVDASDSRDKGGSGLGLAICQSIVQAHGGRIWVEDNEPTGSCFRFTIPLEVAPDGAVAAESRGSETLLMNGAPSILLVEDDLDLARVMAMSLQSLGIRTSHAVNGTEAVRLCREQPPRLIVLDINLPDIDGYSVVAALRESAGVQQTPILVYSAIDVSVIDRARLRLGATMFLTKSRGSLAEFEAHVLHLLEHVTASSPTREDQDAA